MKAMRTADFETMMDKTGRLPVPPHIRRDLEIYKKAAKLKVHIEVLKEYD